MKEANATSHEGKVKSIAGNKLVVTCSQGKEHPYTLAPDAKMTCQGKSCHADALKPGMNVKVTNHKDDETIVTHLDATEKKA